MRRRKVIQSKTANRDIIAIYFRIAEMAGHSIAERYVDRIEKYLANFDLASERGTLRDDLMPGLRIIGFERRVIIAFTVNDTQVSILRVFYGGKDWEDEWQEDE
jgi:toxin ParE1/3/4